MTKLGFVGVGGYGRMQLEHFLPFHHSGRVHICALSDTSKEALEAASKLEGLGHVPCFADYGAMFLIDTLDAVVISAPIPFHEEIALEATKRNLFVLLEKPPVPLLSQLERVITSDTHSRVMVGFQHIYSPLLQRMKKIVWGGEIGQPRAFSGDGLWPRTSAYYDRAGWAGKLVWENRTVLDGPCTNGMSHFVNSMLFVAGETPTGFALPQMLEGEAYRARPIASYDLGGMRGWFENGCEFNAMFSHAASDARPVRITVQGTKGSVEILNNNKLLKENSGKTTAGSDGRKELILSFLAMVEGDSGSNLTPLTAMRAYVLTTNMMFLSSGGIHQIGDRHITIQQPTTPEMVCEIAGLSTLFDLCWEQGTLLRTAGAPWAIRPRSISRDEYNETQMLGALNKTAAMETSL